jgi:hypothetical protein
LGLVELMILANQGYGVPVAELSGKGEAEVRGFFHTELALTLPDEPLARAGGYGASEAAQRRTEAARKAVDILGLEPPRVLTLSELQAVGGQFLDVSGLAKMSESELRKAFTKHGLDLRDASTKERAAAQIARESDPKAWRLGMSAQSELDEEVARILRRRPPVVVKFALETRLERLADAVFGGGVESRRFIEAARACGPTVSEFRLEETLWQAGVLWRGMGSFAELQAKFGARPEPVGTISRLGAAEAQKRVDAVDAES